MPTVLLGTVLLFTDIHRATTWQCETTRLSHTGTYAAALYLLKHRRTRKWPHAARLRGN